MLQPTRAGPARLEGSGDRRRRQRVLLTRGGLERVRLPRQRDPKGRLFSPGTDLEMTAMLLDDLARDEKTEAEPLLRPVALLRAPPERIEDARKQFGRDGRAAVDDLDLDLSVCRLEVDEDR